MVSNHANATATKYPSKITSANQKETAGIEQPLNLFMRENLTLELSPGQAHGKTDFSNDFRTIHAAEKQS